MTFRSGVWGLVLALLAAAAAGCASPYVYYCDEGCGPDALSGRYVDGSAACGACDQTPACGPCEGTPEDPFCGHTVTGYLRQSVTCDAGCGDVYWGEWSYDPPDECDPCNNHGDWVGPQCCPPQGWPKLCAGLHGRRCAGGCCEAAPSCDGGWRIRRPGNHGRRQREVRGTATGRAGTDAAARIPNEQTDEETVRTVLRPPPEQSARAAQAVNGLSPHASA